MAPATPFSHPRALFLSGGIGMGFGIGFEVVSPPAHVNVVARGRGLRELKRLFRIYGFGLWQRRRGIAHLWLGEGRVAMAEIHWLTPARTGAVELKIKRFLEDPG